MRFPPSIAVGLLAAPLAAPPVPASAAPPGLATISISVHDGAGRAVADLKATEVTITERHQARAVEALARDERPLALAILVDTSAGATSAEIADAADAVAWLIASLPHAEADILTIGTPPRWIEPAGPQAAAALRVQVPFGGLSLYAGLAEAARRLAERKASRRAIVIVTSSAYPDDDRNRAFRALGAAAPIVLAVHVTARARYGEALDAIVRWSGGRYEQVGASSGVRAALRRLRPQLEAPWIATYPTPEAAAMHEVSVHIARPGTSVRFRPAGLDQASPLAKVQ